MEGNGNMNPGMGMGMGMGMGQQRGGVDSNNPSSTLNHLLSTPSAYSHLYNQSSSVPPGLPGMNMGQAVRGGMNMYNISGAGGGNFGPMSGNSIAMQQMSMAGFPSNYNQAKTGYNLGVGGPRQMEEWIAPAPILHSPHFSQIPPSATSQLMAGGENFGDGRMEYFGGAMGNAGVNMGGGMTSSAPAPQPSAVASTPSKKGRKSKNRAVSTESNAAGGGGSVGTGSAAAATSRASAQQLQQQVLQQMQQTSGHKRHKQQASISPPIEASYEYYQRQNAGAQQQQPGFPFSRPIPGSGQPVMSMHPQSEDSPIYGSNPRLPNSPYPGQSSQSSESMYSPGASSDSAGGNGTGYLSPHSQPQPQPQPPQFAKGAKHQQVVDQQAVFQHKNPQPPGFPHNTAAVTDSLDRNPFSDSQDFSGSMNEERGGGGVGSKMTSMPAAGGPHTHSQSETTSAPEIPPPTPSKKGRKRSSATAASAESEGHEGSGSTWSKPDGGHSHSGPSKSTADKLNQLYEMGDEPDRRGFIDHLIRFSEEIGTPVTNVPVISKVSLDLYRFYKYVQARGGFVEVQKAKNWKDIATHLGISAPNPNTAYTLKKQYIKFILPYEARFDRGGVDPESLVQAAEALSARAPGRGGTPGAPRKRNRVPAASAAAEDGPGGSNEGSQSGGGGGGSGSGHGYAEGRSIGQGAGSGSGSGAGGGQTGPPSAPGATVPRNFGHPQPGPHPHPHPHPHGPVGAYNMVGVGQSGEMQAGGMMWPNADQDVSLSAPGPEGYMDPGRGAGQHVDFMHANAAARHNAYRPSKSMGYPEPQQQSVEHASGSFGGEPFDRMAGPSHEVGMQDQYMMADASQHQHQHQHMQPSQPHPNPAYVAGPHELFAMSGNRGGPMAPGAGRDGSTMPMFGGGGGGEAASHHPQLQQRHRHPYHHSVVSAEITFPPDSVEATEVASKPRSKLTVKEVGAVDMWKLHMRLKSGLLAESGWAFEMLNIYSSEEQYSSQFKLTNLPAGFLDTILDWLEVVTFRLLRACRPYEHDMLGNGQFDAVQRNANDSLDLLDQDLSYFETHVARPPSDGQAQAGVVESQESGGSKKKNEDEGVEMDESTEASSLETPFLNLVSESDEEISRKCVSVSTCIRNLSAIHGNEVILAKSHRLLRMLGRFIIFNHRHLKLAESSFTSVASEEENTKSVTTCDFTGTGQWGQEAIEHVRENVLVIMANISGHMDLADTEEAICRPILEGLIHWTVCPSAVAHDTLPTVCQNLAGELSAKCLAMEALSKLTVNDSNIDLLIATPTPPQLSQFIHFLIQQLPNSSFTGWHSSATNQLVREFSLVVLCSLVVCDERVCNIVADHPFAVEYLTMLLEEFNRAAKSAAHKTALAGSLTSGESGDSASGSGGGSHSGVNIMMLRKVVEILVCVTELTGNDTFSGVSKVNKYQMRFWNLLTDSSLPDSVTLSVLSRILYLLSLSEAKDASPITSSAALLDA